MTQALVATPVGEQLSAVTFVLDCWQLDFDGIGLTVLSTVEVSGPGFATHDRDAFFRDRLCERMSHMVRGTDTVGDDLVLTLDDGGAIAIGLVARVGPEALIFSLRRRRNLDRLKRGLPSCRVSRLLSE